MFLIEIVKQFQLHIEKYIVKIKLDTRFAVIKETKMVFLIAVIVFN